MTRALICYFVLLSMTSVGATPHALPKPRRAVAPVGLAPGLPAVMAQIRLLDDDEWRVRERAYERLHGWIRAGLLSAQALTLLEKARLNHPSLEVRRAARALTRYADSLGALDDETFAAVYAKFPPVWHQPGNQRALDAAAEAFLGLSARHKTELVARLVKQMIEKTDESETVPAARALKLIFENRKFAAGDELRAPLFNQLTAYTALKELANEPFATWVVEVIDAVKRPPR